MARKPRPKSSPEDPTPKTHTQAATPASPITTKPANEWIGGSPPWEEYCGLRVPVLSGDDREIMRIVEMGGGRTRIIEPREQPLEEESASFELGGGSGSRTIFSQSADADVLLDEDTKIRAMEMSYKFDREDPIYHAIIQGYVNFVVGKGLKFKSRDENPDVQEYIERFWRENRMDGKDAAWVKRYLKTGELSIRWHERDDQKRMAAVPKVRGIPFWRITRVETDAEDAEKALNYTISKATPGGGSAAAIQGKAEVVPAGEISMWHNGDPEEIRGEPPFLSVMRGVKWYSDWLLNRVVLNRYRTAHVLFKKVKGSPNRVSSVSSADPDANSHKGSGGKIEKRLPKPGTIVVHNDSIEYEWKAPELGAGDAATDGRAILTNIAAGAQVPEFLLGDSSSSNYSSILVSGNPFVRQVEFYQDLFTSVFAEIFARVVRHGIASGALPKESWETRTQEGSRVARA